MLLSLAGQAAVLATVTVAKGVVTWPLWLAGEVGTQLGLLLAKNFASLAWSGGQRLLTYGSSQWVAHPQRHHHHHHHRRGHGHRDETPPPDMVAPETKFVAPESP